MRFKSLMSVFAASLFSFSIVGCGGNSDEIAPTNEGVQELSEEDQQKMMKESMEKSGMTPPPGAPTPGGGN